MSTKVKLYDSFTITPIEIPEKNKAFLQDSIYTSSNSPLMVKIAATHSGLITRNNGFYMPDKMRDGATTFVQNYGKPVLLHHNSYDGDPVGRVKHASYVDTSTGIIKQDNKDYLKDFIDPHVSFDTKVDLVDRLIRDGLLDDPSYDGVGYIELIAAITDKEAIQKIADNRYLTVSIGAETDAAVCSICKVDWAEAGDMCEHRPGEIYDGKPAFIIAGNLFYDEVSFVSTPADPHAKIIQISNGDVMDNKSASFEERDATKNKAVSFDMYITEGDKDYNLLKDSVLSAFQKINDNKKEDNKNMKTKLVEDASKVDIEKVIADSCDRVIASNEGVTKDHVAFAVSTHLSTIEDDKLGDIYIEDFDIAVVAISDFIRKVIDANDEELVEIKKDETESRLGLIDNIVEKFGESDDNQNDEPLADLNALDVNDVFNAVDVIMDEMKCSDSKIEDDKRKSVPKTAFLVVGKTVDGVKGYFPVTNADYVKATEKYLEQCDLSDETVQTVKDALDRKAKVFGVSDSNNNNAPVEVDVKGLEDEALKELSVKCYDVLKERKLLDECVGCDESVKSITTLEDRVIALADQLSALRIELKESYKDSTEVNILNAELIDQHKDFITQTIADVALLKGEDIKMEDLKEKSVSELSDSFNSIKDGVDFTKIATKINDGMEKNPDGTIDDPTLDQDDKGFDSKVVKQVCDKYTELLFRNPTTAAKYLNDCKIKGLIPENLEQ